MSRPNKLHLDTRGQWRSRINGKTRYFGTDWRKAVEAFRQALAEAAIPRRLGRPESISGLLRAWLLERGGRDDDWRGRRFALWFGDRPLDEIQGDLLYEYERRLRKDRLSGNTIADWVGVAARAMEWGVEQGWIRQAPRRPPIRRPPKQARDVDAEDLAQVIAGLQARSRAIVTFIAATGCRPQEACELRWNEYDAKRGVFVLAKHKTAHRGQERTIYLTPAARSIVGGQPRKGEHVFASRLERPYTVGGLRAILKRHRPGLTPYKLRHTFAQVVSELVSEQDLAKLMGHRSPSTTRWYYSVKDARARAIASGLALPQAPDALARSSSGLADDGGETSRERVGPSDAPNPQPASWRGKAGGRGADRRSARA